MKVIIFANVFWPEQFLINNLAKHLGANGHTVTAYTGLPHYPVGHFFAGYSLLKGPYVQTTEFGTVIRYPMIPRFKHFIFLAFNYLSNLVSALLNLWRLPKADVYFVFAVSPIFKVIPAIVLKFFTKRPVVVWYQDLWPDSFFAVTKISQRGVMAMVLKSITLWVYKRVDGMLIQSEAFRSELLKAGYDKPIYYVPNWANISKTTETDPEWLKLIPTAKKTLTFAGNIGQAQGLDVVLQAMSQLQDRGLQLVIVGDGSAKAELEKMAQRLGLSNVLFLGRRPSEDMSALFAKSDFLLVSLKKDYLFSLVIPSKVQAYMQAGKPLVAFLDGEGSRVVTEAQCGLSARAEDPSSLVSALSQLLSFDAAKLAAMGAAGRIYFEKNFTEAKVVSQIEDILQDFSQRKIK
ncbi:MAG: glycosyltransferase family 4 protein [Bdellovibrionota bacterium]